jgi:hypothetical protein
MVAAPEVFPATKILSSFSTGQLPSLGSPFSFLLGNERLMGVTRNELTDRLIFAL